MACSFCAESISKAFRQEEGPREVNVSLAHEEVLIQHDDNLIDKPELRRVAMVGDGINDAPALTQADAGIAIGVETDIAIESADVVVMGERLYALVEVFEIGESSYRETRQNLILAFAFNGWGVPLAITGWVYPIWAMVAMVASMTTVLVNSFGGRLLEVRENKPEEVRAGTGPAAGPPVTRSDTTERLQVLNQ